MLLAMVPLAWAQANDRMLEIKSSQKPVSYDEAIHPEGVGVGIVVGEPTAGLSGAYRPADSLHYFAGGVAWSAPADQLHLHGDYVVEYYQLNDPEWPELAFPLYLGIGGRVRLGDGSWLGVRIPVGISFIYGEDPLPLDAFLEIVPGLALFPETSFTIDAALGVRVYPFSK